MQPFAFESVCMEGGQLLSGWLGEGRNPVQPR